MHERGGGDGCGGGTHLVEHVKSKHRLVLRPLRLALPSLLRRLCRLVHVPLLLRRLPLRARLLLARLLLLLLPLLPLVTPPLLVVGRVRHALVLLGGLLEVFAPPLQHALPQLPQPALRGRQVLGHGGGVHKLATLAGRVLGCAACCRGCIAAICLSP